MTEQLLTPLITAGAGVFGTAFVGYCLRTVKNSNDKRIADAARTATEECLAGIRSEIVSEVATASQAVFADKTKDLLERIENMGELISYKIKQELNGRYANKEEFRELNSEFRGLRDNVNSLPIEFRHSVRNEMQGFLLSALEGQRKT